MNASCRSCLATTAGLRNCQNGTRGDGRGSGNRECPTPWQANRPVALLIPQIARAIRGALLRAEAWGSSVRAGSPALTELLDYCVTDVGDVVPVLSPPNASRAPSMVVTAWKLTFPSARSSFVNA